MSINVVKLGELRNNGHSWFTTVFFGGKSYLMELAPDHFGRLHYVNQSPFAWTVEGRDICALIEKIRDGEQIEIPHTILADSSNSGLPSVFDIKWDDWTKMQYLKEVILETVEKNGRHWMDLTSNIGRGQSSL